MVHSQLGEEHFILDFFKKSPARRQFFMDVGAFDGITFSNTRALYELGWKGILIEPQPVAFEKLKELYNSDRSVRTLQVAVGNKNIRGITVELSHPPISQYGDLMLSTVEELEKKRWPHIKNWYKTSVQLISLKEALVIAKMLPDFISIDCEGMDVEVLESAEFTKGDPRLPLLMMIEHNGNRNEALDQLEKILGGLGYARVYINSINAAWELTQ